MENIDLTQIIQPLGEATKKSTPTTKQPLNTASTILPFLKAQKINYKPGKYMQGKITPSESPICSCSGRYIQTELKGFSVKVPICNKCGNPPPKVRVRMYLPNLGRRDFKTNPFTGKGLTLAEAEHLLKMLRTQVQERSLDIYKLLPENKRDEYLIPNIFQEFIKDKEKNLGQKAGCSNFYIKMLKRELRRNIIPNFNINVFDLTYKDLYKFFASSEIQVFDYKEQKIIEANPTERSRSKTLEALRGCLKWTENFIEDFRTPKFPKLVASKTRKEFIDVEIADEIYKYITKYQLPIKFDLIYMCRPCEVTALKTKDVDRINKEIHIRRHWSDNFLQEGRKSHNNTDDPYNELTLPFTKEFEKEILPHLNLSAHPESFIFVKEDGAPIHPERLNKHWKKACIKGGYPTIDLYAASRHSGATKLYAEGVPLDMIKELLGQSSVKSTRRYAKSKALKLKDLFEQKSKPKPYRKDNVISLHPN